MIRKSRLPTLLVPFLMAGCEDLPGPTPGVQVQLAALTFAAGEHLIEEDQEVPEGETWIVEAGATLRFSPGRRLRVRGALEVRGTAEQVVELRSAALNP